MSDNDKHKERGRRKKIDTIGTTPEKIHNATERMEAFKKCGFMGNNRKSAGGLRENKGKSCLCTDTRKRTCLTNSETGRGGTSGRVIGKVRLWEKKTLWKRGGKQPIP